MNNDDFISMSTNELRQLWNISIQAVHKKANKLGFKKIRKEKPEGGYISIFLVPKDYLNGYDTSTTSTTSTTLTTSTTSTTDTTDTTDTTETTETTETTDTAPLPSIPRLASPSPRAELIALRRAQVCEDVLNLMNKDKSSLSVAIQNYLALYNTGKYNEIVYATLGALSPVTIRRWFNLWNPTRDYRVLIPQWKSGNKGHKVPEEDFNWIIGLLHSDGKPSVSAAIRLWHTKLRLENRPQPVSDRTMERAIADFAKKHSARWDYMRHGAKYFRDHYLPSILIDGSSILPGDLWYADGCVCNFQVYNPYTNSPCRPTFLPFLDYASRMITGFDLDFSENRRVIASAYRNAICLWGFVPKYVKWDNGRAFKSLKSKSNDELQEQDEIAEITGNIYATGVLEILDSLPYNPTAKAPIERFFRTFDNDLERFLPNYLGNSPADKPASLLRNEKHLQEITSKIKGNTPLTLNEAKSIINWWILNVYAQEPHAGLNNHTPWEIWSEGLKNIPPERRRNPDELWFLMLSTEIKKLDRNGIKIRGIWYYDDALLDYIGQKVFVRYDQMDDRFVFVFDENKNPICRALPRYEHDPLATVRGSETDKLRLVNDLKHRKKLEKRIKQDSDKLLNMTDSRPYLQDNIEKLAEQSTFLSNISSRIPELPNTSLSIPDSTKDDSNENQETSDEVIPKDFLDALGITK